jgi:hypothetical protein
MQAPCQAKGNARIMPTIKDLQYLCADLGMGFAYAIFVPMCGHTFCMGEAVSVQELCQRKLLTMFWATMNYFDALVGLNGARAGYFWHT